MCECYDRIFESFATSYGRACAYRTQSFIIRTKGEIPETAPTNFTLPDSLAIQQLIGIDQVKDKNPDSINHYDIINFILGIPEIYQKELKVDLNKLISSEMSWFMYGVKWDNFSKLGVLPVGFKGNADPLKDSKYSRYISWGGGFQ